MNKTRFAKISLVLVIALALVMTFAACNFFDGMTKVKTVDIGVDSGLVDSNGDGVYEVTAGGEFKLTVNWHNILISNPTIKWFASVNDGEKQQIANAGDKTLTQTVVGAVGTRYAISASVNAVDSQSPINIVIVENSGGGGGGGGGDTPPTPATVSFTVEISGISDSDSDGYAEAKYGKSFTVAANTSGLLIADPTFDWFVKEDGEERKLSDTASSLTFTISSRAIARYEFRAVLKGGVDSPSTNSAKVEFVESTLIVNTISSSSHTVVTDEYSQIKIQQNVSGGGHTNVVLTAVWNEDEIPYDLLGEGGLSFTWYVDNVAQPDSNNKTFTFNVSGITSACEKVVKVVGRFNGQIAPAISITLSFVEEYLPISKVALEVNQTSTVKVAYSLPTTYKVTTATTLNPGTVTVNAIAYPNGTNLSADCTWTVRDMSGTRTLAAKTRTVDVPLAYGKNVITATIQNMESKSVIVYALTSADLSEREYAIKKTFVWNGSIEDQYINNQEELNNFVGYLVSTHETSADENGANVRQVYLAPSEWKDGVNTTAQFTEDFHTALEQGVDESGTPNIAHLGHQKFWLSTASVLGEPSGAYTPATPISQRSVYVRYSALDYSETRSKVPADDFTETMLVKNSNQLVRALSWGYKPTFESNAAGVKLEQLYTKAKAVLLEYVGKSMTDIEKLQVIYDWLVNEVDYDYAVAEYTGSDGVNFNAYYIEGVFDDHRAVCDGKSKAFALLCGMEGIRAMRIIGTAGTGDPEYWGGHAWNKVLVDTDGDSARDWFFVDCTWGDNKLTIGSEAKETLTYQYFLTTDAAMSGTHSSSMAQPVCNMAYDPYADSYVKVSSTKTVCQYVTTLQQLRDLRDYSTLNGGVMIQVKLDAATEAEIALVAGMGRVSLGNRIYYIYGDTN